MPCRGITLWILHHTLFSRLHKSTNLEARLGSENPEMTTQLEDDVNHLESAEHDRTKDIAGQDTDGERVTTYVTAATTQRGISASKHQAQFRDKGLVR